VGIPSPIYPAIKTFISLFVGFRRRVRVPAELRANWALQLAWQDHRRAFTAGVPGTNWFAGMLVLLGIYVARRVASLRQR